MLDLFRVLMPKEDKFFGLFERHAALLVGASEALVSLLEGGEAVPQCCARISELEEAADEVTREAMLAVRRTFITPFDRSDIQGLVTALDDTIDQMNKTARTALLYEVRSFEPAMREMGGLILQAAKVNAEAVPLLRNLGRNGAELTARTERVIELEGQADEVHNKGLKAAFLACRTDPMAFYVTAEVFDHLEKVMDRFEDVADHMSGILVEHL
jgi:predicted phosphate transport protein (TIGR00153 family)